MLVNVQYFDKRATVWIQQIGSGGFVDLYFVLSLELVLGIGAYLKLNDAVLASLIKKHKK